jgi:hypothetical protein
MPTSEVADLATLQAITDMEQRLRETVDAIHVTRDELKHARDRRAHAAMHLLRPFVQGVAVANRIRTYADMMFDGHYLVGDNPAVYDPDQHDDDALAEWLRGRWRTKTQAALAAQAGGGKVTRVKPSIRRKRRQELLAMARARKHADFERYGVTVLPADVWGDRGLGVSRALANQWMTRMPEHIPPLDADPWDVLREARGTITGLVDRDTRLTWLRDDTMWVLHFRDGWTTRMLADATGLTTTMVAQILRDHGPRGH